MQEEGHVVVADCKRQEEASGCRSHFVKLCMSLSEIQLLHGEGALHPTTALLSQPLVCLDYWLSEVSTSFKYRFRCNHRCRGSLGAGIRSCKFVSQTPNPRPSTSLLMGILVT